MYCKLGIYCENFIFANSAKSQICDVKIRDYVMILLYQ